MLSPKARAFSVDQLLSRRELQQKTDGADDKDVTERPEDLCQTLGGEKVCHHKAITETLDGAGGKVKVELCQNDLWQAFHRLGTEMIITKTGRRMFPAVRVRISGLKHQCKYRIAIDFISVDKNKYRYVYHSSRWMVAGHGETLKDNQSYEHPESPMTGEYMTSQVMSFEKIKLTNNESPSQGQVSLLSMQKFQPRIIIEEVSKSSKPIIVTFPQTAFIAVTAYQNQEITRLKIARNPFAKGFREAGKCRSSLEAMMASFGVLIENGNSQRSSPPKRKLSESSDNDYDRLSPPQKQSYSTNSSCYDRYMLPFPQTIYPTASLNYPKNFAMNSSVIKTTGNSHEERINVYNRPTDSDINEENVSVVSSQNSLTPSQSCLPSPELHPAFRLYPYSQFPVIDPSYLNAYYKALIPSNSLSNMVIVPSNILPVSMSSNGLDKSVSSLACNMSEAVGICET